MFFIFLFIMISFFYVTLINNAYKCYENNPLKLKSVTCYKMLLKVWGVKCKTSAKPRCPSHNRSHPRLPVLRPPRIHATTMPFPMAHAVSCPTQAGKKQKKI